MILWRCRETSSCRVKGNVRFVQLAKILGCDLFWVESEFNRNFPWLQMLVLVFSEISCVQASVSLNPVRTFWFFCFSMMKLLWKKTGWVGMCLPALWTHALCVLCLAQLLGLSMQPGLSGCSKADRGLSGSWWLCTWTGTETGVSTELALWRLKAELGSAD